MKIPEGTLFLLSKGEYSDYQIITFCCAVTDIDVVKLQEEYLSQREEQCGEYDFKFYQFVKWLIVDKKVATEISYQEWHLGGYARDFSVCSGRELRKEESWTDVAFSKEL